MTRKVTIHPQDARVYGNVMPKLTHEKTDDNFIDYHVTTIPNGTSKINDVEQNCFKVVPAGAPCYMAITTSNGETQINDDQNQILITATLSSDKDGNKIIKEQEVFIYDNGTLVSEQMTDWNGQAQYLMKDTTGGTHEILFKTKRQNGYNPVQASIKIYVYYDATCTITPRYVRMAHGISQVLTFKVVDEFNTPIEGIQLDVYEDDAKIGKTSTTNAQGEATYTYTERNTTLATTKNYIHDDPGYLDITQGRTATISGTVRSYSTTEELEKGTGARVTNGKVYLYHDYSAQPYGSTTVAEDGTWSINYRINDHKTHTLHILYTGGTITTGDDNYESHTEYQPCLQTRTVTPVPAPYVDILFDDPEKILTESEVLTIKVSDVEDKKRDWSGDNITLYQKKSSDTDWTQIENPDSPYKGTTNAKRFEFPLNSTGVISYLFTQNKDADTYQLKARYIPGSKNQTYSWSESYTKSIRYSARPLFIQISAVNSIVVDQTLNVSATISDNESVQKGLECKCYLDSVETDNQLGTESISDTDGHVSFSGPVTTGGDHTIIVQYNKSSKNWAYDTTVVTKALKVTKKIKNITKIVPINAVPSGGATFILTLKSTYEGQPVSGDTLTISDSTNSVSQTTNTKGMVSVPWSTEATSGKLVITVKYDGDDVYEAISKTYTFAIKKVLPPTYTIEDNVNCVKGKNNSLKITKISKSTTNEWACILQSKNKTKNYTLAEGLTPSHNNITASGLKLTNIPKGTYDYGFIYPGDENTGKLTVDTTLWATVNIHDNFIITCDDVNLENKVFHSIRGYMDYKQITGTCIDTLGNPYSGNFSILIDGELFQTASCINGVYAATINETSIHEGSHTVTLRFENSEVNITNDYSFTLVLKQESIPLTTYDITGLVGDVITLSAQMDGDQTDIKFYLSDSTGNILDTTEIPLSDAQTETGEAYTDSRIVKTREGTQYTEKYTEYKRPTSYFESKTRGIYWYIAKCTIEDTTYTSEPSRIKIMSSFEITSTIMKNPSEKKCIYEFTVHDDIGEGYTGNIQVISTDNNGITDTQTVQVLDGKGKASIPTTVRTKGTTSVTISYEDQSLPALNATSTGTIYNIPPVTNGIFIPFENGIIEKDAFDVSERYYAIENEEYNLLDVYIEALPEEETTSLNQIDSIISSTEDMSNVRIHVVLPIFEYIYRRVMAPINRVVDGTLPDDSKNTLKTFINKLLTRDIQGICLSHIEEPELSNLTQDYISSTLIEFTEYISTANPGIIISSEINMTPATSAQDILIFKNHCDILITKLYTYEYYDDPDYPKEKYSRWIQDNYISLNKYVQSKKIDTQIVPIVQTYNGFLSNTFGNKVLKGAPLTKNSSLSSENELYLLRSLLFVNDRKGFLTEPRVTTSPVNWTYSRLLAPGTGNTYLKINTTTPTTISKATANTTGIPLTILTIYGGYIPAGEKVRVYIDDEPIYFNNDEDDYLDYDGTVPFYMKTNLAGFSNGEHTLKISVEGSAANKITSRDVEYTITLTT